MTKCKDNNIISNGFQKKVNITHPDKELKSDCQEYQNEASWKMQNRTIEFLQNKRKVVDKEFKGLKSRIFQHYTRTASTLFMQVEDEMKRHKEKLNIIKERNGIT